MTKYGENRIRSRAVKARGPSSPNSFLIDHNPVDLMGDEDMGSYEGLLEPAHEATQTAMSKPSLIKTPTFYNTSLDPDLTEKEIGFAAASSLRSYLRERETWMRADKPFSYAESQLRDMDYLIAPSGSTEDLVGERRGLQQMESLEEREWFTKSLDSAIETGVLEKLDLNDQTSQEEEGEEADVMDQEEAELALVKDYDIKPHHDWSETVVRVDRVQKVTRGGTIVRYRCLVVGGNTKGVAGFGIGKANGPQEAAVLASRFCKRNIYFVDRYMGSGLTHDLVGKHNSCKVYLRAVPLGFGLRGNELIEEILVSFGITDAACKARGNRNVYNVVRATFKALLTHETIEEIAMKRGKRLLNLERARRLMLT